jgi:hypothetical protein
MQFIYSSDQLTNEFLAARPRVAAPATFNMHSLLRDINKASPVAIDTMTVEQHRQQQLQARAGDWSGEFMRSTGNVRAEQWATDYTASIAQQMPNHQLLQSQWQAAITDVVPE